MPRTLSDLTNRKPTLFTSTISGEVDGVPTLLGKPLQSWVTDSSLAEIVGSLFLGRPLQSKLTISCIDTILKLCIDHGPYVSGVVNTMVTARAGRDMVSSVAAGLLTIGPRFGGATNDAAHVWHTHSSRNASEVVEEYAQKKMIIPGIGHRSYRIDKPDPRVALITHFATQLSAHPHLDFALEIASVTTKKKANLILNVDGSIAAVMLDLLTVEEQVTSEELKTLIANEFFNAFFVFSRTAGFIAHFLDQKRLGEGLFRLPTDEVLTASVA
ncbi:MAG: citrate/2-methylcitrate synthase [Candidatus Roizmanbacteria bacterium]